MPISSAIRTPHRRSLPQKAASLLLMLACLVGITPVNTGARAMPLRQSTCTETLLNGGFEAGASFWTQISGQSLILEDQDVAYAGHYYGRLGGIEDAIEEELYQNITLPVGAQSATFSYWRYVSSTKSSSRDELTVTVRDPSSPGQGRHVVVTLDSVDNGDNDTGWQRVEYVWADASSYAGREIQIHFNSRLKYNQHEGGTTSFLIDNISLKVCSVVYLIESRAGDKVILARVRIDGGSPVILSWEIDP
jgi:hypothetical protein